MEFSQSNSPILIKTLWISYLLIETLGPKSETHKSLLGNSSICSSTNEANCYMLPLRISREDNGSWLNKLIRAWCNANVKWEEWDQIQCEELNVALWGQSDFPVACCHSDIQKQWDITQRVIKLMTLFLFFNQRWIKVTTWQTDHH